MKKTTIRIIEKSPLFRLPENAIQIIFIKDLNFRPNSNTKLNISIEKGSVGHFYYIGAVMIVCIKDFQYLIHNIPSGVIVRAKNITTPTYANFVSYNNGRKDFVIHNKTNWLVSFPEKMNDEASVSAGKDLYLLQHTDYKSLTPPVFEKIFNNVLQYCEEQEFYEICNDLMKFAADWYIFYESHFVDQPLLKLTQGWGWLYSLNKRIKPEASSNESKMVEA